MEKNIFIPKRIKAGFQKREGTYDGKLAYVIYFDSRGQLRKQKSWDGWRDQKIKAVEFDNEPQDGFVLNKNIERYKWSDFGSGRSYIRMYDPRGIEFEVTPENLIAILMHSDCNRRQLDGKFVYAFKGGDLLLLPTNSEEYQKGVEFTERQDKKVPTAELVPGRTYTTKKGDEVLYMGRYMWYTSDSYRKGRVGKKRHIFQGMEDHWETKKGYVKRKAFMPKEPSTLASCNSEELAPDFAELIEKLQADTRTSAITKWECKPVDINLHRIKSHTGTSWNGDDSWPQLERNTFSKLENGIIQRITIITETKYSPTEKKYHLSGYSIQEDRKFDTKTVKHVDEQPGRYYGYSYPTSRHFSLEAVVEKLKGYGDIYVTFENGRKKKLDSNLTID